MEAYQKKYPDLKEKRFLNFSFIVLGWVFFIFPVVQYFSGTRINGSLMIYLSSATDQKNPLD